MVLVRARQLGLYIARDKKIFCTTACSYSGQCAVSGWRTKWFNMGDGESRGSQGLRMGSEADGQIMYVCCSGLGMNMLLVPISSTSPFRDLKYAQVA